MKKYTCPMHPEIVRDRPGMCPECGMNLVLIKSAKHGGHDCHDKKNDKKGHDAHAGHKTDSFLKKFWVVLVLTIPILAYSEIFKIAFGFNPSSFQGIDYVILVLASIIFFYGGSIFLTSAYRELKAKLPGMMTLIALAIISAYSFSVYAVIAGREHNLFWELSTLIAIMLLGHWIEMRAVKGAKGALRELAKLLPDKAEVVVGDKTKIVSINDLKEGDIVLVKPGGKVPADGEVVEGVSDINESVITGESKPVSKNIGSGVVAGSINGDGSLKIKVTKIGENTFLSGVMRLVEEAESSKSRLQLISDRAAFYLTIVAVVAGGTTFVSWILASAGVVFAVERLVAVLVITCPHALGLAVPLVASISTNMAAKNGFLVKNRLALESAKNIDTVLFDKTGTLTLGRFGVENIISADGENEGEVLSLASSVNSHSEHPLALAMVDESKKRNQEIKKIEGFERIPGKGAKAKVSGEFIYVGNESLVSDLSLSIPSGVKNKADEVSKTGKTVIFVASDKKVFGAIALGDIIREESKEAIQKLRSLGIKTAMITGDSEDVALWVAEELGIDEYFARVLPGEKSEKVRLLQKEGRKVAMVGDGVNDAPALTQADLGIAIGAGTNVAIESAGIILVKNDPRDIPKIIRLSKLTYVKMIQNLFWATGYNIVALPVAAGALAFKGIILQPAVAAVFMSLSTVIVAINALFLRRKKL